jgi:hypothetical protein
MERTLQSHRWQDVVLLAVSAGLALLVYTIPSGDYILATLRPDVVASGDLHQQAWSFFRGTGPGSMPADYISEYMREAVMPPGFVAIVDYAGNFVDPDLVIRAVSLGCLFFALLFIFVSALSISSATAAICSLILAISIDPIIDLTAGGLPRAAGMALLCLGMLGMFSRKSWITLLAALLSSLFYYSAMALILVFAVMQIGVSRTRFGQPERAPPVLTALWAGVIALTALIAMVGILRGGSYGPLVVAGDPNWPEADYGGRFVDDEVFGYRQLGRDAYDIAARAMIGIWRIRPFMDMPQNLREALSLITFAAVGGWNIVAAARGNRASLTILAITGAAIAVYALAYIALPYLYVPGRFLYLVASPLAVIALPFTAWSAFRWRRTACVMATFVTVALLGGVPQQRAPIGEDRKEVFAFVSTLPSTATLAGWPRSIVEEIPLMTRRRIVVGEEMSLAWHRDYMAETRERTLAVLAAWLSIGSDAWLKLQRDFGATHVIVEKHRPLESLSYYRPYDQIIADAMGNLPAAARRQAQPPLPAGAHRVFANEGFEVWEMPQDSADATRAPAD